MSAEGYATESQLAKLDAEGAGRVDLRLSKGTTTLFGHAKEASGVDEKRVAGGSGGIGGLAIEVTDTQGVSRTATTLTATEASDALEGDFQVPGLVPGNYTVTISGDGYQTQTQHVEITKGEPAERITAKMRSSAGRVVGGVRIVGANPDGLQVAGAGLVLANDTNTYKTTATSSQTGGFEFNEVVPGTYALTTSLFGFSADVLTVVVTAGDKTPAFPRIRVTSGNGVPETGTIRGGVVEAGTGDPVFCEDAPGTGLKKQCLTASTELVADDGTVTPISTVFRPTEEYTLPFDDETKPHDRTGLPPGVYQVTISAPHYETTSITVQVPLDEVVAPTVGLFPRPKVEGMISAGIDRPNDKTCVWAVPSADYAGAGFTQTCAAAEAAGCTTAVAAPEPVQTGPVCALVNGVGAYSIEVPRRGEYVMVVRSKDDEYVPVEGSSVTAPPGSAVTYDATLNRLGRIIGVALEAGDGGALASADAKVSLDGDEVTAADGVAEFFRLDPGTYQLLARSIPATGPGPDPGSDPVPIEPQRESDQVEVTIELNQERRIVLPMVERIEQLVIKVTSNLSGTPTNLPGAQVDVTGPVRYEGNAPVNERTTVMTADADGCVAVIKTAAVDLFDGDASQCPSTADPLSSKAVKAFVSSTAALVRVGAPGYDTLLVTNRPLIDQVNAFSLEPSRVPVSGLVNVTDASNGAVPWNQMTFAVSSTSTSTSSITLRAEDDPTDAGLRGRLVFNDTRYSQSGFIRPGTYTVSASLPGYVVAPLPEFTCQVVSACVIGPITVQRLGSLVVKPVAAANGPVIPNASVTLLQSTTDLGTRDTGAAGLATDPFNGLTPGATTYSLRVRAGGYAFTSSSTSCLRANGATASSVVIDAGATTTCEVVLTRLATLRGKLSGIVGKPGSTTTADDLTGVVVLASPCTASGTTGGGVAYCTSVDASKQLRGTTDAAGVFSITGTTAIEGVNTGTWLLQPQAAGYYLDKPAGVPGTALDGVAVAVPGSSDVTRDITMYIRSVSFKVVVKDQYGQAVNGATVVLLADPTDIPSTSSANSNVYDFADATPGSYTLEVSGAGLITSTVQVDVRATTYTYVVSRIANHVRGTVTRTEDNAALSGAAVVVEKCTSSDPASCTAGAMTGTNGALVSGTTGAPGTFDFTNVPDGYVRVVITKAGYRDGTSLPFLLDHNVGTAPALNVALQHVARNVTVNLTTTSQSDNLTGTTVRLVPVTPGLGVSELSQAITSTGNTSFTWSNVHFGCYDLVVDKAPGHHGTVAVSGASGAGCTGNVLVSSSKSDTAAVTAALKITETQLTITATSTAQAGHTDATPLRLRVSGIGYDQSVTRGTVVVLWVPPSSYDLTLDGAAPYNTVFWPQASLSGGNDVDVAAAPVAATITLVEKLGKLTVTVPGATNQSPATVTVTAAPGQTSTAVIAAKTTQGNSDDVVFDLPAGDWVVTATRDTTAAPPVTITYQTSAAPPHPPVTVDELVETVTLVVSP